MGYEVNIKERLYSSVYQVALDVGTRWLQALRDLHEFGGPFSNRGCSWLMLLAVEV